jgi:prolyl-tRNA synthetase
MGCNFLDQDGKSRPVIMGSYGIGSGRLMACIAEAHHDEDGLVWPVSVAPYQVHLLALAGKERTQGTKNLGDETNLTPEEIAGQIYQEFNAAGLEVLYDDRDESPGVKFKDADLIGLPIRITVSERSLQAGGVEFKRRASRDKSIVPIAGLSGVVRVELQMLENELARSVISVPFEE